MISITRKALGVLVIKPAKGGAQISINASGKPSQVKVRLDIARQGPKGDKGDDGDAAAGNLDKNLVHPQGIASAFWEISHGLGKYPSVTTQDSAGDTIEGDVSYIDINNLTITFATATGGIAYLN